MKNIAIILAAGSGNRMNSITKKQFLLLDNKPLVYYSLNAFEESAIDEIIIVTGKDDIEYCKNEIVQAYNFKKVSNIIEGGEERYNSVYNGLNAIQDCDNVFIHDSARPMITADLIQAIIDEMETTNALIVGMPVKDTIKMVDDKGFVLDTPDRDFLWQIQTPQVFDFPLIKKAYDYIIENHIGNITDDSMVLEVYPYKKSKIKLLKGYYENIKVTTPEDLLIAEMFLKSKEES